jgi:hypothetical protein
MFGSLQNRLQERMVIGAPEPQIGQGATIMCYSDRHPATIVEIKKIGKATLLTLQQDTAKRIDKNGMSESQEYEYERDLNGYLYYFKQKEPNTRWVHMMLNPETNRLNVVKGGRGLFIGEREEYYDFSF